MVPKWLFVAIAAFMILSQFGMADVKDYYKTSGPFFGTVNKIFEENGLNGSVYTDAVKPHSMVAKIDHYKVSFFSGKDSIEGSFGKTSELNASINLYKELKEAGCSNVKVKMNFSSLSAEALLGETVIKSLTGVMFFFETFSIETDPRDDNTVLEKNLPKGFVFIGNNVTAQIKSPGMPIEKVGEGQKKAFNDQLDEAGIEGIYF